MMKPEAEYDRDILAEIDGPRVRALVDVLREETRALLSALPEATARQWETSPVPRPREDTHERGKGGDHPDPTSAIVADPRRLAVRETVVRSERAILAAAATVRATRLALLEAVARFDGEDIAA